MVSLSSHTPFHIASRIVQNGAILTLPGVPLVRHVVADFRWIGQNAIGWLALNDGAELMGHYLKYEEVAVHPSGVIFRAGEDIVALLSPIENARAGDIVEPRRMWGEWHRLAAVQTERVEAQFLTVERALSTRGARASTPLWGSL